MARPSSLSAGPSTHVPVRARAWRRAVRRLTSQVYLLDPSSTHTPTQKTDGNASAVRTRKTYVVAFRSEATIRAERALGFNHSHNSEVNWERWIDTPQQQQQQPEAAASKPADAAAPSAAATAAP